MVPICVSVCSRLVISSCSQDLTRPRADRDAVGLIPVRHELVSLEANEGADGVILQHAHTCLCIGSSTLPTDRLTAPHSTRRTTMIHLFSQSESSVQYLLDRRPAC